MKLSIIIPYYNAEQWISRCLDSLIDQDIDKDDYEIIVVDDGSTNDITILKAYTERYHFIKYVWQKNAMQGAARNKGLEMAKGEYVFFCDSDDYVVRKRLGCIVSLAIHNNLDMLMYEKLDVKPDETPEEDLCNLSSLKIWESGKAFISTPPNRVNYTPWRYITKRVLLMRHHLRFPTDMLMFEDAVFFLNMIKLAGKVGAVNAIVYYYVKNPSSIVNSMGKKKRHEFYIDNMFVFNAFLIKNMQEFENDPEISDHTRNYIANQMGNNAFVILHNTARYGSMKRNKEVLKRLISQDSYPIKQISNSKYDFLKKIMNIKPLWLCICTAINILPKSIRYRF